MQPRDFTKDYSCNQNRRIAQINKAVTWQTSDTCLSAFSSVMVQQCKENIKPCFLNVVGEREKKVHGLRAHSMEEGNMEGENGCGGGRACCEVED